MNFNELVNKSKHLIVLGAAYALTSCATTPEPPLDLAVPEPVPSEEDRKVIENCHNLFERFYRARGLAQKGKDLFTLESAQQFLAELGIEYEMKADDKQDKVTCINGGLELFVNTTNSIGFVDNKALSDYIEYHESHTLPMMPLPYRLPSSNDLPVRILANR